MRTQRKSKCPGTPEPGHTTQTLERRGSKIKVTIRNIAAGECCLRGVLPQNAPTHQRGTQPNGWRSTSPDRSAPEGAWVVAVARRPFPHHAMAPIRPRATEKDRELLCLRTGQAESVRGPDSAVALGLDGSDRD